MSGCLSKGAAGCTFKAVCTDADACPFSGGPEPEAPSLLLSKGLGAGARLDLRSFQNLSHGAGARKTVTKYLVKFDVLLRCEMWIEADNESEAIELLENLTPSEVATSAVSEPTLQDSWIAAKLGLLTR